jgi:LysR family transcriptional regulator, cyn operon transcriptional activator
MEIRLLEYFQAVCEELHFTKAADKLGISQSTLSQQISLLEGRLGTPLFRRLGKKNYLTDAGQILLSHSLRVFHELDQAKAAINEVRGLQRGKLNIGCSGNHLLTSSVLAFHKLYPKIELSVQELATEETREGLLSNQLDIGVVFLPLKDEQLESITLYDEALCLAVSTAHELADADHIKLERLHNTPTIVLPQKFLVRQMIDSYCNEAGFDLKPIMELSTLDSLLQLASKGAGAAILPGSYLKSTHYSGIRSIPITDPIPHKKVGIVYRKETHMSSAMDAFISQLRASFTS